MQRLGGMTSAGRQGSPTATEEPASELFGLGCDADPLMIGEQYAIVLFLEFLEDSDLLFEILDGLPEFPVDAVGQTGDECDPCVVMGSGL